jgi:ABC-type nickel/cobalt efflux system permease component RcnA
MPGLDGRIAALGDGHTLLLVLAVALLLGLRHATDPDHLTAVSVLIASEHEDPVRRAGTLGLAWGLGHATTLLASGIPIVIAGAYLPGWAQRTAEVLVGVLITLLALRLLVRWRRGRFHVHAHRHGRIEHRHLHPHGIGAAHDHVHVPEHDHEHVPDRVLGRSPLQAYGIGMVHGVGGSAGIGILLLAGIPDHALALAALLLLALATALSMCLLSCSLGLALTRGRVVRRALALAPALGTLSLAFGVWYTLGALELVRYAF